MGITEQIEEAKRSDSLLLLVFYADWSPHYEWIEPLVHEFEKRVNICLLYTSPSPRDRQKSRMPSSA